MPEFELALDDPWPCTDEAEFAGGMIWSPEFDSGPCRGGGTTTRTRRSRLHPVGSCTQEAGGQCAFQARRASAVKSSPGQTVAAKTTSFRPAEQLPEKLPRAEFAVEVKELELAELQLRRVGELLILGFCVEVVGVGRVPRHG